MNQEVALSWLFNDLIEELNQSFSNGIMVTKDKVVDGKKYRFKITVEEIQ